MRYYGSLIRDRAREKIGHLYPKVRLPKDYGGGEANVVAWIWARTVASPNPAMQGKHVPLLSTFWLSSKTGKQVWLEPVLDEGVENGWRFEVRSGTVTKEQATKIKLGTRAGKAQDFYCLLGKAPISRHYVQAEGKSGRLEQAPVAIVAEGRGGKIYVPASSDHASAASMSSADPQLEKVFCLFWKRSFPELWLA